MPVGTRTRTRIALSLALASAVALCALLLVGCGKGPEPGQANGHPAYDPVKKCAECHKYAHAAPYTGACERCHVTTSWRVVLYTHRAKGFDLGIHPVLGCPRCHTASQPLPKAACGGCHKPSHAVVKGLDCAGCHTALSWRIMQASMRGHVSLLGGHAELACTDCHASFTPTKGRTRTCTNCHKSPHGLGVTGCERCHDPERFWKSARIGHTVYELSGTHARTACAKCHPGLKFVAAPASCTGCHKTVHGKALALCFQCHATSGWKPARFSRADHAAFLPLTGGHTGLACTKCHKGTRFADVGSAWCGNCHGTPHGAGTMTSCTRCHTVASFSGAGFDHSRVWALTGAHSRLACSRCHKGLRFSSVGSAWCGNCHGTPHGRGLNACLRCHNTTSFRRVSFSHSRVFALTGAHARLACSRCHPGNRFAQVKGRRCVDCHGVRHGGLRNCSSCHTTRTFRPSTFRHSRVFALTGAHARLACSRCHANNAYARVKGRRCVDCHGARHGGLTACSTCHTTVAWLPHKVTRHPGTFRVGSAHMTRRCSLCHRSSIFTGTPRPCADCHDTPHVGPTDCRRCHWATTWGSLHFTHPSMIYHEGLGFDDQCSYCHPGRDYTRSDCSRCHDVRPPA